MCGIAGIIYKNNNLQKFEQFEIATRLMNHRGPDAFGKFEHGNLGLYHYRLSILDLDDRSNQPFFDELKEKVIVYNGEVYNYKDIAKKYNIIQQTTSDTEVIMKLITANGFRNLNELNGIFAFAFFDLNVNLLTIARDRLGVKPLYYYEDEEAFMFASEAKVILKYLSEFSLNFQALTEFLWYGSSISEQTIIEGVKKLEPGTFLQINRKTFKKSSTLYWSIEKDILPLTNKDSTINAVTKSRMLIEKAVERQCIADVPIGAYLSGGVDSSTIVAFASRYATGKLNTYSVDFDFNENGESELPLAKMVAKKYGTNHHEFRVETKHIADDINEIVFQYDEPFADAAALPLHLMAKSCSGLTKVVLQGDGGDEVFAGYGRYTDLSQLQMRKYSALLLSTIWPSKIYKEHLKKKSFILNQKDPARLMGLLVAHDAYLKPELYFDKEWKKHIENSDPFNSYKKSAQKFISQDVVQKMLYTDMEVILRHTFLEKVDKINMFHSIEARVPFLDNDVVDFGLSLPSNIKLQQKQTKYLIKEAMKGLVPDEILFGRKKSFVTPLNYWLRNNMYQDIKSRFEDATKKYPYINSKYLLQLLEEHKSGQSVHTTILWRMTVLLTWLDFYSEKLKPLAILA